jgi:methyltransferase family protein
LARSIREALGDARTVVNVGAGAGSYEPADRSVVAVEPSAVMIAQRAPGAAPAVEGAAEALPFADSSFDAAMAIITLHHWSDCDAGLAEMVRVATQRVVLVTFDLDVTRELWIVRDYLPEAAELDAASMPPLAHLVELLPGALVAPLLVPHDCTDRMFTALWARPEQYLDPHVRAATSVWHQVPKAAADRAIERLREDLVSGTWDERHGRLRETPEWDVGLRLIRAELVRG